MKQDETKNEITPANETGIVKQEPVNATLVQVVDLSGANIAELEKQMASAEALPFELTPGYWTPEKVGEAKKVILKEIKTIPFLRQDVAKGTGEVNEEVVELETAFLVEVKDGVAKNVTNAAWRLVKALKQFQPGSTFLVTYLGKKKNSSNGNSSDDWSVKPLMLKMS